MLQSHVWDKQPLPPLRVFPVTSFHLRVPTSTSLRRQSIHTAGYKCTHTHSEADSLLSIRGSGAGSACLHNGFLRMYALRIAELQKSLSAFIRSWNTAQGKWEAFGVRSLFSPLSVSSLFFFFIFYLSSPLLPSCAELNSGSHRTPPFFFLFFFSSLEMSASLKKKKEEGEEAGCVFSPSLSAGVCQR